MVNFSVFNELSLPISKINMFDDFFKILEKLREFGLEKIRMDKKIAEYPEILPNTTFQQLLGQVSNRDKQRRLKSFINNSITVIESPLIKEDESEDEQLLENEYFYNGVPTEGGLACCDIWDSVVISFLSNEQWNKNKIVLKKQTILDTKETSVAIRHASKLGHLDVHQKFFDRLEKEKKLAITQENFWNRKEEFFPDKIVFCKEVEKQMRALDKTIFQQAINILRDIETKRKLVTDYNYSSESQSVKNDDELKKYRYFTVNDKKVYFENHIKSLFNANRIYFIEQNNQVFIGYIGKHLPTKKYN